MFSVRRALPAVLAALLPALVLGVGAYAILRFEPPRPAGAARELANAGRVMNGRRLNVSVVERMERDLAQYRPDVLVLGNSYANTNVVPRLLAEAWGLPPRKVRVFSVPNSVGSHWYAILKNRVYANGHHPPLVVVVSPLQSTLLVEPYSESSYTNLWVHMDPDEPVLDRKVPRTSLLWRKLRQKRGAVRDGVLAGIRDAAIGLVFGGGDDLRQVNDAAMERVFHDRNVDMSRYRHALPVAETRDGETGPGAVPHPADSMLPELTELATANGSRLVFVRTPMAPRTPPDELDAVPDGWEEAAAELVAASGHVWADLYRLPVQDALFHNPGHMTDEGARLFTRALVRTLAAHGLTGPERRAAPWRPAPPRIEVQPPATAPHPVAELLDGVVVPPGSVFTARFDEGWDAPADTWDLQLVAELMGPGPAPRFHVAGTEVRPRVRAAGGGRKRLRLDRPVPPPGDPWSLVVDHTAGVASVVIQGIRVGRGTGSRQVVGRPENLLPAQVALFDDLSLRDGRLRIASTDIGFAAPPPPIEPARREARASPRRNSAGTIEAPDLDPLSDAHTVQLTELGARCSPVRLLRDGTPLPRHHETCAVRPPVPRGRVCHGREGRLVFTTPDDAPVRPGPWIPSAPAWAPGGCTRATRRSCASAPTCWAGSARGPAPWSCPAPARTAGSGWCR